jgi:hypothetical protein
MRSRRRRRMRRTTLLKYFRGFVSSKKTDFQW